MTTRYNAESKSILYTDDRLYIQTIYEFLQYLNDTSLVIGVAHQTKTNRIKIDDLIRKDTHKITFRFHSIGYGIAPRMINGVSGFELELISSLNYYSAFFESEKRFHLPIYMLITMMAHMLDIDQNPSNMIWMSEYVYIFLRSLEYKLLDTFRHIYITTLARDMRITMLDLYNQVRIDFA